MLENSQIVLNSQVNLKIIRLKISIDHSMKLSGIKSAYYTISRSNS